MTLAKKIFNLAENSRKLSNEARLVVEGYSAKGGAAMNVLRDRVRELEFQLEKLRENKR